MAADTCMNREVIHSLLALFDEGVTVDFPIQVFHYTVHLFKSLVDRYGADRHRAVTDNPFTCFADIFSCREIH